MKNASYDDGSLVGVQNKEGAKSEQGKSYYRSDLSIDLLLDGWEMMVALWWERNRESSRFTVHFTHDKNIQ